jgi:hypothetical protein
MHTISKKMPSSLQQVKEALGEHRHYKAAGED